MKIKSAFLIGVVFLACQNKSDAVYSPVKKGDITFKFVTALEAVASFNADPDADPNFLPLSDAKDKNPILAELRKQKYFEGDVLNVKKLQSNAEYNKKYFLDVENKISFIAAYKSGDITAHFKVQQGDKTYTYLRKMHQVEGISLLDLNKDGVKEIIIIQFAYFVNTMHYYFEIYEAVR